MLSIETEDRLAAIIKEVADSENHIEVNRLMLAEQTEFEPYSAFKRLDKFDNGFISHGDIVAFYRDNAVFCADSEAYYILRYWDTNHDGRLSFNDFCHMILPHTSEVLRSMSRNRQPTMLSLDGKLPFYTEKALAKLLNEELLFFRRLEDARFALNTRFDYSTDNCYRCLDRRIINFISE